DPHRGDRDRQRAARRAGPDRWPLHADPRRARTTGRECAAGGREAAMRSLLLAFALVLTALPAPGQQLPPLTLDEARRLSGENNPALQRAHNGIVSARAGELSSRAAFLPGLSLNFNSGGSLSRNFTGLDPYGKPV